MVFNNLDNLFKFLKSDSNKKTLNPVRFISVDSLSMWIEVKKYLVSISDLTISLSKYCEDEDTTPNMYRFKSALRKTTKTVFVSPLSEYLRIVPGTAENHIKSIIKSEYQFNDNGTLRIYILMYRMKSVLKTIPKDDPRAKDSILYLETDDESDYELTIIQKNLKLSFHGNEIYGFKNYLEYWETNPDRPIVLYTNNAIYFENNNFIDNVRVISTSYDLIKLQYGLPSSISFDLGSAELWNRFAKIMINEESFIRSCCNILSINRFSIDLFKKWTQLTPFQKWVLWMWTRIQDENLYVSRCAKESKDISDFVEKIYCLLSNYLDQKNYEECYKERKEILKNLNTIPTEAFWKILDGMEDDKSLKLLTDLTDIERKRIFTIISKYDYFERSKVVNVLKLVYNKLYRYLINEEKNKIDLPIDIFEYFQEYKWLKATDGLSESFIQKVNKYSEQKGESVFKMTPRTVIVSDNYIENETVILFVDGMGIEYLDYLMQLFDSLDNDKYSSDYYYGYCTLPSITEINKDFLTEKNVANPSFMELDELKHSNNTFPNSIIKQLTLLDDIKDRAMSLFTNEIKRVIISSDHGTSRMAVKVRNTKWDKVYERPRDYSIYKYGRYCDDIGNENDFSSAIPMNDKLIFSDYSRFVQNGAPIDEIHGGASLEEWIVPVIVINKIDNNNSVYIVPEKNVYKTNLYGKIQVRFKISIKLNNPVFVSIKGTKIHCNYEDGLYSFVYSPSADETHLLIRVICKGKIGEFSIDVEQAIATKKEFDI